MIAVLSWCFIRIGIKRLWPLRKNPALFKKRGIYWHVHVSLQHINAGWNSVNCLYVLRFIITIFG